MGFKDILKETIIPIQMGFSFPKNHFLFHATNDAVQRCLDSGIIQSKKQFYFEFCTPAEIDPEIFEPKVFRLQDLAFGFVVWLTSVLIAIVIGILEVLCFYLKKKVICVIKNCIGLYYIMDRLDIGFGV
jgi:hypothetical protein